MVDRDKLMKRLKHCAEDGCKKCPDTEGCVLEDGFIALVRNVLDLLKAQEPRVLTLEEIEYEAGPMWYEERNGLTTWALYTNATVGDALEVTFFEFFENYDNSYLREYADTYNICWRVWTARPTEEQRRATKWDEVN